MSGEIVVGFPGGRRVNAQIRGFEVATDQQPEYGGDGSAPEPFELFMVSLATCAGIYAHSFCKKRDIPTDGLRVVQTWETDPETRRLTTVTIRVETPPEFPEKYRGAIERSVDQCAVKKAIFDPPEFIVDVVPSGSLQP